MMRGTGVVLLLMLVACFVTAQGKSIQAEGPGNGYPPIPPVQVGICVEECSHVISCPPDYICRSTGCGTVCRDDDD
ncbi:WAP four-disulfide core domain protein 18-like isoform X2 [Oratosquilla oratoria]|uniref:WAP four-disulfide core domain protein 18-like isoform X2 n=1 Tax=Oratosquilla oratoria TaxID=337810 RepID=UPI003F76F252